MSPTTSWPQAGRRQPVVALTLTQNREIVISFMRGRWRRPTAHSTCEGARCRCLCYRRQREKADIALRRGSDHCILYQEADFSEILRERTGGRAVDVVYDSVGRTTFERSLRCLRRRGHCVLFGVSSGPVAPVSPFELAEGGARFSSPGHTWPTTGSILKRYDGGQKICFR
jgi:Zinc-binding dehydrogenase